MLGNNVMRGYYMLFDDETNTVGVAPQTSTTKGAIRKTTLPQKLWEIDNRTALVNSVLIAVAILSVIGGGIYFSFKPQVDD